MSDVRRPRHRAGTGDTGDGPIAVTFVMEQQVGLRTFSENLRRFVDADPRIMATWVPITYIESGPLADRVSRVLPSHTLGQLRGRRQVRRGLRRPADVRFYLTQVPAVLGGRPSRSRPYVVMTDVTPRQYDEMADGYGHRQDRDGLRRWWKHRVNRRVYQDAAHVFGLSDWNVASLRADYGCSPERTSTLAPGVDLELWSPGERSWPLDRAPRILFVGGDFVRKGGDVLLQAFASMAPGSAELHLVTGHPLPDTPGVTVHRGLTPNSPALIELFRECDVFALPSRAETFGQVLVEAMATALPCVVTSVGAMPDIVGEAGLVVPPDDSEALAGAIRASFTDPGRWKERSAIARRRAEDHFDGARNAMQIDALLIDIASRVAR